MENFNDIVIIIIIENFKVIKHISILLSVNLQSYNRHRHSSRYGQSKYTISQLPLVSEPLVTLVACPFIPRKYFYRHLILRVFLTRWSFVKGTRIKHNLYLVFLNTFFSMVTLTYGF